MLRLSREVPQSTGRVQGWEGVGGMGLCAGRVKRDRWGREVLRAELLPLEERARRDGEGI